jgi:hypothetical protein
MGQSRTQLADGRTIWIAGEHEDYYDPDFFIYNDVIIEHSHGRVEVRGYPIEVFPPTDFHSATAIDEERSILIVGSIGYQQSRDEHRTPVYRLNTADYQIVQVETTGASPGWIHKHTAERSVDGKRLTIRGGEIMHGKGFIESIDDWALCLEQFVWTRLTDRRWPTYQVHREDGKPTPHPRPVSLKRGHLVMVATQSCFHRGEGCVDLVVGWSLLTDTDAIERAGVPILRLLIIQYRLKQHALWAAGMYWGPATMER